MPARAQPGRAYAFAKEHGILPGKAENGVLPVFLRAGANPIMLGELTRYHQTRETPLMPQWVSEEEFGRLLTEIFGQGDQSAAEVADDIGQNLDIARLVQSMPPVEDLLDSQHDAPIIRMINVLLTQALRDNASDIHIEPFEGASAVRFRLDGVLHDIVSPNRALHAAMVSRVKVMASLDIAEKRLPQDGRMSVRVAGKATDVRVSTLPTHHGERVVMRLLDKNPERLDLAMLGMAPDTLERIDRLIRQPHGIILVTGPTGSGKTTTLYAALSRLDARVQNIMTVEDPVEYDLHGIGQVQVNPRIDMHFATALRAILRQDPDIVMIGEIRDLETAQIAVQASLTGHLVLATLHTNDAVSALARLQDMGVEPFLLASSLLGVIAQRLVRRLCPECRAGHPPTPDEMLQLQPHNVDTLYQHRGCNDCARTGYRGRYGIYELLELDDELRGKIHQGANEQALRRHAVHSGHMRLLREDGLRWVLSGDTSLEELHRVSRV